MSTRFLRLFHTSSTSLRVDVSRIFGRPGAASGPCPPAGRPGRVDLPSFAPEGDPDGPLPAARTRPRPIRRPNASKLGRARSTPRARGPEPPQKNSAPPHLRRCEGLSWEEFFCVDPAWPVLHGLRGLAGPSTSLVPTSDQLRGGTSPEPSSLRWCATSNDSRRHREPSTPPVGPVPPPEARSQDKSKFSLVNPWGVRRRLFQNIREPTPRAAPSWTSAGG